MRRLAMLIVSLILMMGVIVMPASAENTATKMDSIITVTADGDCMVSTTVRLRLDSPVESLVIPLSPDATDIVLNGGSPRTTKTEAAVEVDASRIVGGMTGEQQLSINYNIPKAVGVVKTEDGKYLQLDIPLLSSFSMPVQELNFIINLPENIKYKPIFNSIYQQTGIEASLTYNIEKTMLTGRSIRPLNDHEAITMSMVVTQEMFPSVSMKIREGNPEVVPMLVCGGLALV